MAATVGSFADLLEPALRVWFLEEMGRPAQVMEQLFGVTTSTKFEERYEGIGALGLVQPFKGTVEYEDFDALHRKDIRNYELAQGITITRQMWDDDQTNVMETRARGLGASARNTVEHDAVQVFVNGFTDSGTNRLGDTTNGGDGVALMSLVHPQSPVNTGNTQANEGTLVLSLANLDTTRQAMQNFTDDKGLLLGVNPDTILVPPELERTVTQIVSERANFEPGSAQFDVNMFAGRLKPIVWNRLTDSNAWFIIDSRLMKLHLKFQWRIRPEFNQDTDTSTTLMKRFQMYMRYGIGFTDWRWIFGNNPS